MAAPEGVETFLNVLYGAAGGALTTFVALRTRLAMMQRDIDDGKRSVTALEQRIDARLERVDRRQIVSLQVLADVARKVGADGRFSDQLVRFLASDAEAVDRD